MPPEDFTDSILKWQHRVDARANALGDELVKALEAVQDRLIGKLAMLPPDQGAGFTKRRLEAQRAEVDKVLSEVYQGMGQKVKDAGADVMEATAQHTVTAMNAVTGLEVSLGLGLTKDLVTTWFEANTVDGLLLNEWLDKLEAGAADRIISVGRQAMIEGMPVQTMARLLRSEGIEGSVPALEGLARTFCLSASNYAREQTSEALFSEVMNGWRRMGVLDRRTCLACGPLDGAVYSTDEYRPSLPAHWNCRCVYIPIAKTWDELGMPGQEEAPEGTRPATIHDERTVNHRDGSTSTKFTVADVEHVPASTTYQEWMKGQLEKDPAFVREVLGKTRFELFSQGKLTLNQMTSNGRILKLSELPQ